MGRPWQRRRSIVSISLLLLGLVATACGSGGDQGSKTEKVTVGVIAIVDVAPIYLGKSKGFFSDENIDLNLQVGSGGAASVPGVVSGKFQFAFANIVSLLIAREKGLPLKIVSNGVSSTGQQGKDFAAVMVKGDSDIKTAKDLSGKVVGVNNQKNICDTTIRASIRKAGGDPKSMKPLELPFPDQPPALQKGQIDAACLVEPFVTIARSQGARPVASNYVDPAPDLSIAMYFTTEKLLKENPELVERFTRAMKKSMEYADAHPDEVRKILGTYTKITPDIANQITLPKFPVDVNQASTEAIAKDAQQDGTLTKPADIDALFANVG
ncbi:ABC transporter substrate-binding protein [Flindersiella endophytica]